MCIDFFDTNVIYYFIPLVMFCIHPSKRSRNLLNYL